MSELQTGLLAIGFVVVLAVLGYNWLQQRKYRRKFGETFEQREDALYRTATEEQAVAEPDGQVELPAAVEPLPVPSPDQERPYVAVADDMCSLLEPATDYIAVLKFNTPEGADVLAPLWQKRFDFGKGVQVCGLNAKTGAWEKVFAESHLFYAAFKLGLQLADRSGAASEVSLSDFRDLARDIAAQLDAQADLPDVAAASARAVELDNFCAGVDQMIGLNILPGGERAFAGGEVVRLAAQHGLVLQADGAFHLADEDGHTVFTLGHHENIAFQHQSLAQMQISGLTLLLDVPRVAQPARRFGELTAFARQLAQDLRGTVVDDHRVALGDAGIAQIREQIGAIEKRMLAGNLTPGGAQARRLFS